MTITSGADALVVLYAALPPEEQERAFRDIAQRRLESQGYAERELAKHVRSLRRVADALGHFPGVKEYQDVSKVLIAEGEELVPFKRLYAYFGQNWASAREALELSGESSIRAIDARFAHRRLGKPVRYSEDALRETLARCVEHFGRPPNAREFNWWRDRQLEAARARGERYAHLPTDGPYRHRWRSWEATLLHFGYTPDAVAERIERREQVMQPDPYLPDDLPVARLASQRPETLPLTGEEMDRLREAFEAFPRRTRYVLTVRLGLGVPKQTLREAGEALALHLSRIQQIHLYALDALVETIGEPKHARPGLRADVIESLRLMAAHDA